MGCHQWQLAGSIWSLCFLLLFPHPSWYRRFIFLFLVLVILLATSRAMTSTLTLTHLASAARTTLEKLYLDPYLTATQKKSKVHYRSTCER